MQRRVGFAGGFLGCIFALVELYPAPARAEAKPSAAPTSEPVSTHPTAPAAPAAPDVVLLKDGGMLRGTIAETKPGEFVSLLMISGELRKIPFEQVSYAGPSAGAPSAAPPPAPALPAAVPVASKPTAPSDSVRPLITVEGPEAKVQFESSPIPITLTRRSDSAGFVGHAAVIENYSEICAAPCRVSLPAGTYNFGASAHDRSATSSDPVSLPAGESVLHGEYQDNKGLRIGGAVLLTGGVLAGTLLSTYGLIGNSGPCDQYDYCPAQINTTEVALGGVLLGVGLIGGFILISQHDKVTFTVSPGAGTPPPSVGRGLAPTERKAASNMSSQLSALHLTAAF